MIKMFFLKIKAKGTSRKYENGFLMLYTILLTSIMLAVGLGIIDVALKQISFSGIDRESVRAFYAADAGLECALYGDRVLDAFSTSSPGSLTCNEEDTNLTLISAYPPSFELSFHLNSADPREMSCVLITLDRTIDPVLGSVTETNIAALGYNTECPPGVPTRFPHVERGIKTTY